MRGRDNVITCVAWNAPTTGEHLKEEPWVRLAATLRDSEWRRVRPIDGATDWPAISAHFRERAGALPRHAATFPWWWANGAYNLGVQRARRLGHFLSEKLEQP